MEAEFQGLMYSERTEKTDQGTRTERKFIDENGVKVQRIKYQDDWQSASKVQIVGRTFLGNISYDEYLFKDVVRRLESTGYEVSGKREILKEISEEFEKTKEEDLNLYKKLKEENEGKPSNE